MKKLGINITSNSPAVFTSGELAELCGLKHKHRITTLYKRGFITSDEKGNHSLADAVMAFLQIRSKDVLAALSSKGQTIDPKSWLDSERARKVQIENQMKMGDLIAKKDVDLAMGQAISTFKQAQANTIEELIRAAGLSGIKSREAKAVIRQQVEDSFKNMSDSLLEISTSEGSKNREGDDDGEGEEGEEDE